VAERVPSDHPSVTTFGATVTRTGGTHRPSLRLPDDASVSAGDEIRLSLDSSPRHARVERDASGLVVRDAADNRRLLRNAGDGVNHLVEWCQRHDRGPGDAVELDEVEPGFFYGLRVPGKRTVYEVVERPDSSLAAIADRLDEE
jgi:hypothetical protein